MKSNARKIIRYISFLCAVLIMVFIFFMSSENATESAETSGRFIKIISAILNKNFDNMSEAELEVYISKLQFIVRKLAHFSVYFALGLSLSCGILTFDKPKLFYRSLIAFLIASLYSVTDEIHQYFVPGRSCEAKDVLIDSSGAFFGIAFIFIIYLIIKKYKNSYR